MSRALMYMWTGESFEPIARHAKDCDKDFVVGEHYWLEEIQPRSQASHAHEFAWLADAWRNLPERYDNEPWAQSPEHLRKFALIQCKFCITETFTCGSNAEALRWAPRLRADDEYCIVSVSGSTVHRFRAESQSKRSMGARRFQESKTAIMEYIGNLLSVPVETLRQNAGASA